VTRKLKAGECYVLFGGEVRAARTFPTLAAAELARGGEHCWLVTTKAKKMHRRGYVSEWETIIVSALKRQDRHERTWYTWTDSEGEQSQERRSRGDSFATFAEAKAHLVAQARKHVAEKVVNLQEQRAELRRMLALKPYSPGKAVLP
jgi:hypothetical protein